MDALDMTLLTTALPRQWVPDGIIDEHVRLNEPGAERLERTNENLLIL